MGLHSGSSGRLEDAPRVIVQGNPVDGIEIIGPFPDHADALEYAERHCDDGDWWITPLTDPGDVDTENEEDT